MFERLTAWIADSIDWHGFGRTRGAFVDGYGIVVHASEPSPDALVARGGLAVPAGGVRWDPWAAWTPPTPRISGLLPVVRAPRGEIRFR